MRVITNFPLKSKQFRSYARKLGDDVMKDGMFGALEIVGTTAVDEFMKMTSGDKESKSYFKTAATGNKLRIRQGKLSRSIAGVMDFSGIKYPTTIKKHIKGASKPSSGKKDSIRQVTVSGSKIEGTIGSKVKYAAIHEWGGKAGRNLSVTVPKRSYVTPAVKESMPDIHEMFDDLIHTSFRHENI